MHFSLPDIAPHRHFKHKIRLLQNKLSPEIRHQMRTHKNMTTIFLFVARTSQFFGSYGSCGRSQTPQEGTL
jgi:hypothetical protein